MWRSLRGSFFLLVALCRYLATLGRGPSRRFLLSTPNPFSAMGAAALYRCLRVNHTLKELRLGYNCLGDSGANSIARALSTAVTGCSLTFLSLAHNGITGAACADLAAALRNNTTLSRLVLAGNDIGCRGAFELLEASKAAGTLQALDFTACGFKEDSECLVVVVVVAGVVPGSHVLFLSAAAELVCDAVADHPSLLDLVLDQNDIGDIGALSLSHSLTKNTALTSLSLVHCHVCEGGARRILHTLETKNRTLRSLVRPGSVGHLRCGSLFFHVPVFTLDCRCAGCV